MQPHAHHAVRGADRDEEEDRVGRGDVQLRAEAAVAAARPAKCVEQHLRNAVVVMLLMWLLLSIVPCRGGACVLARGRRCGVCLSFVVLLEWPGERTAAMRPA